MADSLFPNPHPEEPFREPVAKLAKMITDRAPVVLGIEKITKESPEYIGLSALCTDEMAEIALKMGKRKPRTLEDMVKITGKDKTYLEDMLQKLAVNGVIEYNWENPRHEKQYVLPMFVPGSAEFANMNEDILREHPEMGRFFERMSRVPLEKVTHMVPPGGAGIGMHVIPVEKAIQMENQSVSVEHISHWLDKYGVNMRQVPVPAAVPAKPLTRAVQTTRKAGALLWEIWQIMWWKPIKEDATLPERKLWTF